MFTYTPANSIFDGPLTNLLSTLRVLTEVLLRVQTKGKRGLNNFKFGTFSGRFPSDGDANMAVKGLSSSQSHAALLGSPFCRHVLEKTTRYTGRRVQPSASLITSFKQDVRSLLSEKKRKKVKKSDICVKCWVVFTANPKVSARLAADEVVYIREMYQTCSCARKYRCEIVHIPFGPAKLCVFHLHPSKRLSLSAKKARKNGGHFVVVLTSFYEQRVESSSKGSNATPEAAVAA